MKTDFDTRFDKMSREIDEEFARAEARVKVFAFLTTIMILATIALLSLGSCYLLKLLTA